MDSTTVLTIIRKLEGDLNDPKIHLARQVYLTEKIEMLKGFLKPSGDDHDRTNRTVQSK